MGRKEITTKEDLTRREQEIPHFYKWGMNCDKHGVFLTFMFHSIII